MDSASFKFVIFGLVVALLSNLSRSRTWRSFVLLLASIVYLGFLARNPLVLLPLIGFLLLGYAGIILLERGLYRSFVASLVLVVFAYIWLNEEVHLSSGTDLFACRVGV